MGGPIIAARFALRARLQMATKRAYRAILRELYKAVRILPHHVLFLSHPLRISSPSAQGPHEVGQRL